ncbi:pollen-specific leucine-rich repeat extensin-like protein 1, partial [Penaeus japonicus]|uniref:pollen-specific leucine-rich repeat extensin-like protein 1 n=1 Tax=Penaeus japonicus TaxID=27405 RepID=UPI001C71104D
VLRDIMSQAPGDGGNGSQGVAEAYNPVMEAPLSPAPAPTPAPAPAAPRERIITIRMEGADGESDDSRVPTQPAPRVNPSQPVHHVTNDMGRLSTSAQPRVNTVQARSVLINDGHKRQSRAIKMTAVDWYVCNLAYNQQEIGIHAHSVPSRWIEEPNLFPRYSNIRLHVRLRFVSREEAAPVCATSAASFIKQPQQLHNLSPQQQQQFAQFLQQQQEKQQPQFMQQQPQPKQQPQFMQPVQSKLMPQQKQPSPTFMRPQQQKQPSPPLMQQQRQPPSFMQTQQQKQPSPPFSQAQQQKQPSPPPVQTHQQKQPPPPFMQQQKQPSPPFMQQQKQPSPPFVQQQKQSSPQYLQQPKQPSPPKQSQQADVPQAERAAFWRELEARRQDFGLQNEAEASEPTRPPRRNSRQDSPPQDNADASKPLTYFGQQAVVHEPPQAYYYNGEGTPAMAKANNNLAQRPREGDSESGPRYTSVVTLSSDKGEAGNGAVAPRDKVRSVVQLNSDQRGQARPAPVVRGFRQPSQLQSRSSVSPPANSSVPAPLLEPVPQAPTAARLVAALSQPAPKAPSPSPMAPSRVSPPRSSPSRVSPPRTSPSRVSPPAGPAFQNVQLRPVPGGSRGSSPPEVAAPPPAPVPPPAPPAPMAPPAPPAPPAGGMPPPPPPPAPPMAPPPPPAPTAGDGERRTASGKRIVAPKTAPSLDPREELMMAIRNAGGSRNLRKTHNMINH